MEKLAALYFFKLLTFLTSGFLNFPGIYEATSLDLVRKDSMQKSTLRNGVLDDGPEMSPLPT